MPSTPLPSDRHGAHDALFDAMFDEIERELAALTHAPLMAAESPDAARRRCVDEFATDFLNWSMPPRRDGPLRR